MRKITSFKLFESTLTPELAEEKRMEFRKLLYDNNEDAAIAMIKLNPELAQHRRQVFSKLAAEYGKVKLLKYMLDNCNIDIRAIKEWMKTSTFYHEGEYVGDICTEEQYKEVINLLNKY